MKAPVNKIIPLSIVDGPGNRTSVFLQKCNIACAYCHNPETQQVCNGCGTCVNTCPVHALRIQKGQTKNQILWDAAACVQCDTCIQICPNFSSPKVRYMEARDVFDEIQKNIPFIRGITTSGGECTLYPEFLTELFTLTKAAGLTCYIDSNGATDLSAYPALMEQCDKVMLDVKSWNEETFFNLTGSSNEIVKRNLLYLAETNKLEEVRIVCLEPEVDVKATICGISETVKDYLDTFTLKLIAFRNHGVKTELAGRETPSNEQMETWKRIAVSNGFSHIRIV